MNSLYKENRMKNYVTINMKAMLANGLSPEEWILLTNIQFLSKNTQYIPLISQTKLRRSLGFSRSTYNRRIKDLIAKGFLVKYNNSYAVTTSWVNISKQSYDEDTNRYLDEKMISNYLLFWNEFARLNNLIPIKKMTFRRINLLNNRMNESGDFIADMTKIMEKTTRSHYLLGLSQSRFKITLDHILQNADDFNQKIMEGYYDDRN